MLFLGLCHQSLAQFEGFFEVDGELCVAYLGLVSLAERGGIVAVVVRELISVIAA